MIDAHNHLQDPRFSGRQGELIQTMKSVGITACIVNGTSEEDWPEVARLATEFPDFVRPSFGLHPWKIARASGDWFEKLRSHLLTHPQASIGECGLDRWMENPQVEAQQKAFRQQLTLALELQRPLTIHCLKAWGVLLEELKNAPALPRFLLHSFSGSWESAQELLKLGAYFSFSGHFLHPRKEKVRAVFKKLPPERILIETDAPDMPLPNPRFFLDQLNHPANLCQIAEELAQLIGQEPALFVKNTERFRLIS